MNNDIAENKRAGGTPTLHPSIISYVYGRARYQTANRRIMTFQAVIMPFSVYFMSSILAVTGSLAVAYKIMMVLVFTALGRNHDHDRR
jgi:hypothetical protein